MGPGVAQTSPAQPPAAMDPILEEVIALTAGRQPRRRLVVTRADEEVDPSLLLAVTPGR